MYIEDIFGGGDAIEVIVRWHEKACIEFNKNNTKSFEQIKNFIEGKELKCIWSKVNDQEQKIIIPLSEQDFQLELNVEWNENTFSHKIKVNSKKKTKIVEHISEKHEKDYSIEETCKLVFIDINEARFPIREQLDLNERVKKLEISPKTKYDNDLEIWGKYIKAQEFLLKRNAQPFSIRKYSPLEPIKIDNGTITKYKFTLALFKAEVTEYKELEEELRTEFNIFEQFDAEGNIKLKYDDIVRGLDLAIEKKFNQVIEREKLITCILQIRTLSKKDKILDEFKIQLPNCTFSYDFKTNQLSVFSSDKKINKIPTQLIEQYGLKRIGLVALKRSAEKKQEYITLELNEQMPDFDFEKAKLQFGNGVIQKCYEEKSDKVTKIKIGEQYIIKNPIETPFTDAFWQDLKRDLYSLDFNVVANDTSNSLAFDFENIEDCKVKYNKLKAISKFEVVVSPDKPFFNFKVKTNLVKNKFAKQLFTEKLKNLIGVEFHFSVSQIAEKRKNYLAIGKLSANESDDTKLVFILPFIKEKDKKVVKNLLEYIEKELPISSVEPNLIGDTAKIDWLREAMEKLINPVDRPNKKPVNEKLGQFIFDSSKAEGIFIDISKESEEWRNVQANELLKLNDSQREAVLTALFATDLCLLQGPPGTGKTTVIAEMIWQFIFQNQDQKILLTSETNLAVDNAIEKLLSKDHTLVKPIRFGKVEKFEEEGKKYSYDRIMNWMDEQFETEEFVDSSIDEIDEAELIRENINNNAVQIWMNRIAESAYKNGDKKYENALKTWSIELSQAEESIKKKFGEKYFKFANVVGSTCSSAGSGSFKKNYIQLFNENELNEIETAIKRKISIFFDIVIMDEASKATPPEMLLPLCFGKKSIIIGDHKQLPPMLNEKDFKEALLEIEDPRAVQLSEEINRDFVETSQFERLIMNPKVSKTIVARLNIQYRMHPKINNVIKQFYTGETDKGLNPAQELLDNADDTNLSNPFSRHHGFLHDQFIKPEIHTIWVNVDEPEEQSGTSRVNEKEADAVKTVLTYLKNSSGFQEYFSTWESIKDEDKRIQEQEIGIISFYGHQVKKLKDVRMYSQNKLNIPIRLNTVDKFQGMERNIVIVSTVRSNKIIRNGILERNADIGFAKAPERLNVALSRARRLLIVVGNLHFFESYKDKSGNAIYKNAIEIIRKEGLIIEDYKTLNKYK